MAERQEDAPYKMDTYNPFFTERKWTPFYKRYTFSGAGQADQAANLVTSPSFTKFWSGGGEQADNTSLVRVNAQGRETNAIDLKSRGKYDVDFKPTPNPFPKRPIPPEGIRPIKWVNNLPELLDPSLMGLSPEQLWNEGGFRPDKFQDIWPQLSPEEQAWWDDKIRGKGGYNDKYFRHGSIEGKNTNVPSILQNKAGALTRPDRVSLTSMLYHVPDTGTERWINASSPSNLFGVSAEFKDAGMSSTSDWKPRLTGHRLTRSNPIEYISTTNPDVALSVGSSAKLMQEYQVGKMFEGAIGDSDTMSKWNSSQPSVKKPLTPLLDIPKIGPEVVGIQSNVQEMERRAGSMRRVGYINPTQSGNPESVIFGPPVKGMAAEMRLNNTLHYGGKTLGVVGATSEGMSIPWRKYQILNQMRKERGEAPMSEPYDINRFPEGNISDQMKSHMLATGEAFVNFGTMGMYDDINYPEMREQITPVQRGYLSDNGQRVPNWIPNLQSTYQGRPRYERQGVSFNHLYPQAPR